uniref:Cell cycle control protein n=1 Tax=Cyprinodon variegatus TaxID=28743 RepID=A0A3Q2D1U0_CYPVA
MFINIYIYVCVRVCVCVYIYIYIYIYTHVYNQSNRIRTMVKNEPEKSSDRPDNTAFTQQRLPAWQPILSAGIVIPGFVLIGLAFIGVGVALFITSRDIQVLELDYTGVESSNPCSKCTDPNVRKCICTIVFSLDTLFKGPVFMYYGLTNYFQNQRRYGVSRDDNQLYGDLDYFKSPGSDCAPFDYDSNDRPIVPCGALANSMFNDDHYFSLPVGQVTPPPRMVPAPPLLFVDYPVVSFNGRKKVVLSNVSWMGGKNDFLGIAYLVVGSLCIVMSIVMLIVYFEGKKNTEEDCG